MGTYDSAFKKVFSDKRIFAEFIEAFVPALRELNISEENLILENVSFTDPALGDRESDLLYKIKYRGNDVFLYVLVEHQSTVDQLMPFRLLVYMTRIWERYVKEGKKKKKKHLQGKNDKLPLIIPVVFYDGENEWTVSLNFKDKIKTLDDKKGILNSIDKYIPKFEYELVELAKIDDNSLLSLKNALGLLLAFDSSSGKDLSIILKKIKEAFEKLPEKERNLLNLYLDTFLIVFKKRNNIELDIDDVIKKNGGDNMFTIFEAKLKRLEEKAKKEGIEKGIKEGIEKGIKEGVESTVRRALKVGLDKEMIAKITGLSIKRIEDIEREMEK